MDVGREQWPHVGASSIDPRLAPSREEARDRTSWPTYGVGIWCQGREEEQAIPIVGEGCTKGGRRERELIVNEERAGGSSLLLGSCAYEPSSFALHPTRFTSKFSL
ncbi:unnamed protein product [Spirodela intermedia]|uniref:Uncharacterized protein n=2 Tax=Spirodela intermedia TaxID=51605 RepID=A0A7I8JH89_SPIIN|nr:unnamed protein product [Spirodela intermedia]CAA6669517.1 unnamed protein product [Spirodela intermedia]CAA7406480.1 unnamed protein product [Spirodela intermedia]